LEFREQLKYPPTGRVALLTLKGRNEDKVKFSAEHVRRLVESRVQALNAPPAADSAASETARGIADLQIVGPAPAPLLRAENYYRYHLMLRTRAMTRLSQLLAQITTSLTLPDDVTLAVDIDPVDLG
jgi:primosomal protein N' (replication factor Y)